MARPPASRGGQNNIWDDAVGDINSVLFQHETSHSATNDQYTGISKKHWKPNEYRSECANDGCRKKFTLLERHHHCRRCGDLFCAACCKYRRRLNSLSHPDPMGIFYKVCKSCYDQGPQQIGQVHNLQAVFLECKRARYKAAVADLSPVTPTDGVNIANFRERINFGVECQRLKDGFKTSIGSSSLRKKLTDLTSLVKTPEWLKSSFWVYGQMCKSCCLCGASFSLLRGRHICSVCGGPACAECSSTDLLLYVSDECRSEGPLLAVIEIKGCPEKEPNTCMYLRVCRTCNLRVQEEQLSKFARQDSEESSLPDNTEDWLSKISKLNSRMRDVREKITVHLPKYQELVDALEIETGSPQSVSPSGNNMQVLAKAQSDLADHLTSMVMSIQSLKTSKPTKKTELVLLRNHIRSQCEFYHEHMFLYRSLKRKLEKVTPVEVLEKIQQIVDYNAINSCYLSVKQLGLEALGLCIRHKMPQSGLVQQLAEAEDIVLRELRVSVRQAGEDWRTHQQCVDELLQTNIKEHRLIRPSTRLTKRYGARHITEIQQERVHLTLQQIYLQLTTKCTDRQFTATKDILKAIWLQIESPADNNTS